MEMTPSPQSNFNRTHQLLFRFQANVWRQQVGPHRTSPSPTRTERSPTHRHRRRPTPSPPPTTAATLLPCDAATLPRRIWERRRACPRCLRRPVAGPLPLPTRSSQAPLTGRPRPHRHRSLAAPLAMLANNLQSPLMANFLLMRLAHQCLRFEL
jgi:hypothetical protein